MKLLYLSCHSILEYDEIKLFSELGIEVFSMGYYSNPLKNEDPKRPPLNILVHPELEQIHRENQLSAGKKGLKDAKEDIDQRLIDWADVIYCAHIVDWLTLNWAKMKGKRIIWRSIGQSTLNVENLLRPLLPDGLEIVRYSPRESTIPGFAGEDAMIRFYKDEKEFGGYTGENNLVITLGQSFKERENFCNYKIFDEVTRDYPRKVYGGMNQLLGGLWGGNTDYEQLKKVLRESRVFFYTGTYPAGYTLSFIEAWMTGIPIVALGPKLGNSPYEMGQQTYEVPDLIARTGGGFVSDDIYNLKEMIKFLLRTETLRKNISEKGRAGAIEFFGKDKIKAEWKKYFGI